MLDVLAQLLGVLAVVALGLFAAGMIFGLAALAMVLQGITATITRGGWWSHWVGSHVTRPSVASDPYLAVRWLDRRPLVLQLRAGRTTHIIGIGPTGDHRGV